MFTFTILNGRDKEMFMIRRVYYNRKECIMKGNNNKRIGNECWYFEDHDFRDGKLLLQERIRAIYWGDMERA